MAVAAFIILGCKQSSAPTDTSSSRGEPTLVCDTVIYNEAEKSFTLMLHADSTADAKVTYFLLDGEKTIMQSNDGQFSGIAPLDDGYNVVMQVEWPDTTITTPKVHIFGFVIPKEPVEKMPKEDLQKLINANDKGLIRGEDPHLAQGMKLTIKDSKRNAQSLQDVKTYLVNDVWKSVIVTDVTYDDNNLITTIVLKPVGEVNETEDEEPLEDEDY